MAIPRETVAAFARIASLGHEIGVHVNAVTAAILLGVDATSVLADALADLRYEGFTVAGAAAHGDRLRREVPFTNQEVFSEWTGPFDVGGVEVKPRSLAWFGLEYEAYTVQAETHHICDSGGEWGYGGRSLTLANVAALWPRVGRKVTILQHPEWWNLGITKGHRRTFGGADLDELDAFLRSTARVVPFGEFRHAANPHVVGMRHDVDSDLPNAVRLAEWEAERGYRSTYFVLHTSEYWPLEGFDEARAARATAVAA